MIWSLTLCMITLTYVLLSLFLLNNLYVVWLIIILLNNSKQSLCITYLFSAQCEWLCYKILWMYKSLLLINNEYFFISRLYLARAIKMIIGTKIFCPSLHLMFYFCIALSFFYYYVFFYCALFLYCFCFLYCSSLFSLVFSL